MSNAVIRPAFRRRILCTVAGIALGAITYGADVHAAGFALDFEGTRALGAATAGAASAADATTVFYNPAGLTYLKRSEYIGGGQLFLLHDRFHDQGSTILGGALPTPGGNGSEAIPTMLIPWIFGAWRITDDVTVGAGFFAPFGLKTDYGPDFVGRYQAQYSSLSVLNLNGAIAYKALPWLSVAAGASAQHAHVHLKQAIDFGSACVAVLGPAVCAAGFGLQAGQSDGHTELKGNDVAFGYNAGVLAEPIPGTRLGVSYRSRIDHRFGSAKQTFDVPATARAFLAAGGTPASAFTGSDVSTALQLPARFTLAAMQTVAKGLDVYLDATLTKWSVLDATVITPKNLATGAAVVINQNYQDAWRYAIGANYVWNDEWSVRAGLAYDETPIPTAFVQATIPDRDRVYYSLGASYRVNKVLSMDVGYTHVRYVGQVPIDRAGPSGDRLFGRFDVGGNIVAAQVKFQP